MSYDPDVFGPRHPIQPMGGSLWEVDPTPDKNRARRGPMVHWLDSEGWYALLEWGVDPIEDFIDAIKPFINDPTTPEIEQGDTIIGKDKNGLEVIIHANQLADNPGQHEQKEAPK